MKSLIQGLSFLLFKNTRHQNEKALQGLECIFLTASSQVTKSLRAQKSHSSVARFRDLSLGSAQPKY